MYYSHNIEFMIWHFMLFFRACAEPLHTLILVGAFLVYMHRRLCKLSAPIPGSLVWVGPAASSELGSMDSLLSSL